jgi:hypothetical protein
MKKYLLCVLLTACTSPFVTTTSQVVSDAGKGEVDASSEAHQDSGSEPEDGNGNVSLRDSARDTAIPLDSQATQVDDRRDSTLDTRQADSHEGSIGDASGRDVNESDASVPDVIIAQGGSGGNGTGGNGTGGMPSGGNAGTGGSVGGSGGSGPTEAQCQAGCDLCAQIVACTTWVILNCTPTLTNCMCGTPNSVFYKDICCTGSGCSCC